MTWKHTPGPWEVADLPHGTLSIVVRTKSPNKTKFGASRYAAIGGFDRSDLDQYAEALANARLIAAAPDLLEACWAMVTSFHGVEWMEKHMQESIAMGRAAIAKATGGEV